MIRKMYPEAEITVLVRNYNYDIVKNLPYISRVVKIDDYKQRELLEKIEYFKSDLFIALFDNDFVSELAKRSRAKIKVGPYSKLKSFFIYNHGIRQKRSKSIKHEAEYNLDLVRKVNPELFDKNFEINCDLHLDNSNREVAEAFYKSCNIKGKSIVVNPFMGGSTKNLRDEEYCSIIKEVLRRKEDLDVILTVHHTDNDRALALKECIGSDRVHIFANMAGILNTAAVIERCDLYFSGGTGPTHIADALKKEMVAFYPDKRNKGIVRWGAFPKDDSRVTYIIFEYGKKVEFNKNPYYESYTKEKELEIIDGILNRLQK
jgi:ADP-heptose:LPS heptosyltransferase